ncbi:pentapeptide repeat-containing protein [Pleurocapsa sp. PCC 7319]|uniref:pentapeptide repeat-containing protein n=1 Tax=Pleurocapsa sp. PCC 7319 TaxID=118161 RepID=UPI00035D12C0|nr:pentapeptide repeat-containing protein [Pleurocapsa sp. PCC 7319]
MAAIVKSWCMLIVAFCLILFILSPLEANAQSEQRIYLTPEILDQQVNNLVQQEGKDTIDLSNYIIDISNPDSEFSQQFYREIRSTINRATNSISLDLSNSIIQGDLQLNQLGILTSLGTGMLSSTFTPLEQEKINQYYPLVNNVSQQIPRANILRCGFKLDSTIFTGEVNAANSLFLQQLTATSAKFQGVVKLEQSIFGREVNFSQAIFNQNINLSRSHFFAPTKLYQVEFQGILDFSNSQIEAFIEFNEAKFYQLADFTRSVFIQPADFSKTIFRDRLVLAKAKFLDALIFINSTFEKNITFRDIYANSIINLQDAHLLDRIDFSNAFLTPTVSLNVSGLAFDSAEAKIIGETNVIGNFIRVERLEGNETVLRNLIRNFRSLEQIADANQIEYQREQLRAKQLSDRLTKISWSKIFSWSWLSLIPQWLSLNLLLLLGDYGTNINLLFSIGIVIIAFFGFLFWLLDRYRPRISQPIIPNNYEIIVMGISYLILTFLSILNIFIASNRPGLTLVCIALICLPIPILIISLIYRRGRYHKLLDTTYFVEDGSMRQFRLLLGRLPIMPRFPFFRDRYQPILWQKRWNWLNYYDFSANNIFKLGFNDIRLRDRHLPGLIATLVWYQWCIGVLYIILLLWTLSRTIPGLNLLIYF